MPNTDLWLRFLMLKNRKAPAMSMPSMVMVERMLYRGTLMWRLSRRTNVRSLGGSTPKRKRRWAFSGHFTFTLRFPSSLWQLNLPPSNLFLLNHKIVTLQQTSSYLRPISWSSVSFSWVHVSLCTTVKLLWLDSALSYLLLYFSPTSVPIDRNSIILHISTYCGQGCGNKHLRCCCVEQSRVSLCGARQRRWSKRGRVAEGENSQGDRTNYKVCQHKQTWEEWKMDS